MNKILKNLEELKIQIDNTKNIDYSLIQNFDWFYKIVINYYNNKTDEFIDLNEISPNELFELKINDIKNKLELLNNQ